MSDEEHHFESKADAGASKTYPQQASTIRKTGYIVIECRPCKDAGQEFRINRERAHDMVYVYCKNLNISTCSLQVVEFGEYNMKKKCAIEKDVTEDLELMNRWGRQCGMVGYFHLDSRPDRPEVKEQIPKQELILGRTKKIV